MNRYRVTIKRVMSLYVDLLIDADNEHTAREKVEKISEEGDLPMNDFFIEATQDNVEHEYIYEIQKVD